MAEPILTVMKIWGKRIWWNLFNIYKLSIFFKWTSIICPVTNVLSNKCRSLVEYRHIKIWAYCAVNYGVATTDKAITAPPIALARHSIFLRWFSRLPMAWWATATAIFWRIVLLEFSPLIVPNWCRHLSESSRSYLDHHQTCMRMTCKLPRTVLVTAITGQGPRGHHWCSLLGRPTPGTAGHPRWCFSYV